MTRPGEIPTSTDPDGPSPLEQAMAVYAGNLGQQRAAEAERYRRSLVIQGERARRQAIRQQRSAEQAERNREGLGTNPEEVLDSNGSRLCREFIDYMHRAEEDDGVDRFAHATRLPLVRNGTQVSIRGFLIGCSGEEPMDSGAVGDASGLYLCEDGALRTYRADRTKKGQPVTQGVPLTAEGEFEELHPGHFGRNTIPRRRVATIVSGKIVLPEGVESGSALYTDSGGKTKYQSQQVHPFQAEPLEQSLAATAYFAIQEDMARPVYNRFEPAAHTPIA
jgi:hypothetical protein